MTTSDMDAYREPRRSGGLFWFWAPLVLILFVGGAFSVAAYTQEAGLSAVEAMAIGFGGLAALIVGLIAAAFGVILGLFGALLGIVAAGGAIAVTLFLIASPIIALALFVLLLRRPKSDCPDPSVH